MANIYNTLQDWEWDDRLGSKPDSWDTVDKYSKDHTVVTKFTIITQYSNILKEIVSEKEIMKDWHINGMHKNIIQFYLWWYGFTKSGKVAKQLRLVTSVMKNLK